MPFRGATLIGSEIAAHSNRTGAHKGHRYEAPDNGGDTVAAYSTRVFRGPAPGSIRRQLPAGLSPSPARSWST